MIAVVLTGSQTYHALRASFLHSHRYGSAWLLPVWMEWFPHAGIVLNLFLEAYLVFVMAMFLWRAAGLERVVTAGYTSAVFLSQIQDLVPSLRAPFVYVKVVAALVAFIAALAVLVGQEAVGVQEVRRQRCNGRNNALAPQTTVTVGSADEPYNAQHPDG